MIRDYRESVQRSFERHQAELEAIVGGQVVLEASHMEPWNCVSMFYVHEKRDRDNLGPRWVAEFKMSPLPGNARVVVFHEVNTRWEMRGKGLGTLLLKIRMEAAAEMEGIGGVLATVHGSNEAEMAVLTKAGWHMIGEVYRGCGVWVKDMTPATDVVN